ncbi:MAG: imidazole glycerol phosphate synthase subunit HisH [Verrucomicrobiales bacterium]|jgi:glutamine amidotransferase|nr:imidazole glycerol phosphate synthase subunit HisH [Verrucomicrobiales bacterium]
MNIGLIDYGRGNLHSVDKALELLGANVELVADGDRFAAQDALVLPGVGAFGDAMRNLAERGLVEPIRAWVRAGKPFLGICLGYQLLFDESDESPNVSGLGLVRGRVVKFPPAVGKIPHMGWNNVTVSDAGRALFAPVSGEYFYHVHSYFPQPADISLAACWTEYEGVRFASGIVSGRLAAFQFHPEKSQANGLRLLGNFLRAN